MWEVCSIKNKDSVNTILLGNTVLLVAIALAEYGKELSAALVIIGAGISILGYFSDMVSVSSLEVAGKDVGNYKMETGQIDLRDIQEDMYVENGEVKIQNIQTAEAYELQKELSNSDNLNDLKK